MIKQNYHILPGAATATGHGGVQVWIAKKWKGGMRVAHNHLRILHSTPRMVFVSIKTPSLQIGVASIHCPNNIEETELVEWWKEVDTKFSLFGSLPVFIMIDSNSRVGSVTSASIGSYGADHENASGQHFHVASTTPSMAAGHF